MTVSRRIPVSAPALVGNEKAYVMDCLESTWISSNGTYLERFEHEFAGFCGTEHALACCNGTVALHLALVALGVGPGDEVLLPTLTFVATANAVAYCGARPVFVDSEPHTWNMDPEQIEEKITPRTKAIIVVHLYGHPANMGPILTVAREHGLPVIEDAAEAHGAEYRGRRVGSIGDIGTFSFYGNKIITTGEGGMIVTSDTSLYASMRQLRGQGMDPHRRYWFPVIGYNYRMTNVAAAIGLAQLEKIAWHIEKRRCIASWYSHHLRVLKEVGLQPEMPWARNVYWMTSAVLTDDTLVSRDHLMSALSHVGVETRPFFYPMHSLPMYQELARDQRFPIADSLARRGLNLPSFAGLSEDDVAFVCEAVAGILRAKV